MSRSPRYAKRREREQTAYAKRLAQRMRDESAPGSVTFSFWNETLKRLQSEGDSRG